MISKIVTIGGGTGAPTIIKSLILAGYSNIQAISSSMDNGGRSGTVRTDERDRIISVGDLFKTLLALIPPDKAETQSVQAFIDLVNFTDGRKRNLGYTVYYALMEKYHNNFLKVQRHLEKLLALKFLGTAIPVTLQPTDLGFTTQTGSVHWGEHELDRLAMSTDSVSNFYLESPVKATAKAIKTIKSADFIIFCPGSLYGSILSNLLPKGITVALKSNKGKKILITNLVSDRNQTHQIHLSKYLKLFDQYSGIKKLIDVVITPKLTPPEFGQAYPRSARNYAHEHSYFLGWPSAEKKALQKSHLNIISSDMFTITHRHRLRHDPQKLAPILKSIIS